MEKEAPNLPVEVISYILHFLSTSDRKEASLVNRAWYAASLDQSLQKNVFYHLQGTSDSLEFIRDLGQRQASCVALSDLDASATSKMVVQNIALHLAPHLKKLFLRDSNITESSFMALVPSCRNLRGLDLSGCNSLFLPGTLLSTEESKARTAKALVDLRELNLSNLRYLSDLIFNRLTECTPKLQMLALAACPIAFEFDPYRGLKMYNSTGMLTLNSILSLLCKQAATLKCLNFSRTSITSEAIQSVVQVTGLHLEVLLLRHCKDLTDDAVCAICMCQPGLTTLDLTGCAELTNRSVSAVTGLPYLEHLFLGKIRLLTDNGLKNLSTIPTLQTLDLSECYQVSGLELVKGFVLPQARASLVSLNFSCCTMVKDEKPQITTESDMEPSKEKEGASLKTLTCLKELCLTACTKLTDASITREIRFQELKTLTLSMVREITDESVISIAAHCRSLEGLALNHCAHLTDQGMIAAACHMKRLTNLEISCCDKITNQALEVLMQQCKWLRSLDVSMCGGLLIADIERLQHFHPRLTSVKAKYMGVWTCVPDSLNETG
ncbi:F-box/LRR-repeat protein 2-like isoform X4 [Scyliorhinus canicula]|uniref:F-box/LRR-repeat protein 2-like isoform X4 n=1 Tax=Scyliorhinus canicula TaxID=7830 RepID=UPI0018F2F3CA|nr:F-box/LRR-repeat protein 2-like isoform X4 [Scyliorhinus canicula]